MILELSFETNMWTCQNCENQSEENFKFCWSCGKPRGFESERARSINTAISFAKQSADEPKRNIPQVTAIEREENPRGEAAKKADEQEPEITIIEPIKSEPERKTQPNAEKKEQKDEKKPKEPKEPEKIHVKIPQPELFSTFLPENERGGGRILTDSETDWETIIFTTAVRLVGLYFIFLVITAIPDFVSAVYTFFFNQNVLIETISDFFATAMFFLTVKILFYLIVGIYLISSGRILLWFLPRS